MSEQQNEVPIGSWRRPSGCRNLHLVTKVGNLEVWGGWASVDMACGFRETYAFLHGDETGRNKCRRCEKAKAGS